MTGKAPYRFESGFLQRRVRCELANPVGPLLASSIADRIHRKWQLVGSCASLAVFGLVFSQMTTAAGIIVMGVLITFSTTNLSYSFHAFQAELYPTALHSVSMP